MSRVIVNEGRSALTFPQAKLNLGLRVLGTRDDGFHDIQTAMLPIAWHDSLEIQRVQGRLEGDLKCELQCHGLPIPGGVRGNLIVRAYELLDAAFDLPATAFHLVKTLPIGAGLGGGSSDGAHALMGLNALYDLQIERKALAEFSAELGSDCPFFLGNGPAWVTGRGDNVQPWIAKNLRALSGFAVAVIFPAVHVDTAAAFAQLDSLRQADRPRAIETWQEAFDGPAGGWGDKLSNDFQAIVANEHPEIGQALNLLKRAGALWSMMSGSGSTVFGLFDRVPARPAGLPASWHWWAGTI